MTRRPFVAAALVLAALAAAAPADVVILKDGFVIQGRVRKELEVIEGVTVPRGNGFDYVDDGPRLVIFSSHHKQLGEISKDLKIRPDYKAYRNLFSVRRTNHPLPPAWTPRKTPDFNDKWKRTIEITTPGGFERIDQQVTFLDPYTCFIASPTHTWTLTFRTSEMDPKLVRTLLDTHPELAEPDRKYDPLKRVAIARFLKDVGWLDLAKDEFDLLPKFAPGPLPKETQEAVDGFAKELDRAIGEKAAAEAELAVAAGRYERAGEIFAAFPAKTAHPDDLDRLTRVKAKWETAREQYAAARRLLADLTGAGKAAPFAAAGGGLAGVAVPPPPGDAKLTALRAAAEAVYAEAHPDTAARLEFFVALATQAEKEKAANKAPTRGPAELLATAVSGWAKGKVGATPDPDRALKIWAAREAALAYQRGNTKNARLDALARYKAGSAVGIDELTQVIALLPPAEPEDLTFRTGTPVTGAGVPDGVYRRSSAPFGSRAAGVEYCVRPPAEYQHGRAAPVAVLLSFPGVKPEEFMMSVAAEADRHGYILVAPAWSRPFDGKPGWEWNGEDHDYVTHALRDVVRHFAVDTDRVFLIGAGEGGNMAMDVGASHPDLFAGVVAVGPNPKWQGLFLNYWKNAQRLPFYVVSGALAGEGNQNLRFLYERWMSHGYPAIQVLYKGRGAEWFPAETPVFFEWMGKKRRANGLATLQLGTAARFGWQTQRETDNRFYWLGADRIDPRNVGGEGGASKSVTPAEIGGDIKGGNKIQLQLRGVRTVSVWLGRDMIDWTKQVLVSVNGTPAPGWRPRIVEQDVGVLLEDYYQRGDRRMLYLARIELESRQ